VAAAQQAAANYQATVVTAFQNVANTLAALEADAEVFAADAAGERAARDSLTLVQVQLKSGAASYTQVLTAEQTYQNAAIALVKARAQRYADTAALFQALGGGWWNRTDVDVNGNAPDCCKGS
jgi:outer membrane protein TolC